MKPTITIIHDSRRSKKSGKYPVKLRITFMREQKYYPVGLDLTMDEFVLVQNFGIINSKHNAIFRRQIKEYKFKCDAAEVKAYGIIDKLDEFSFRSFEKKLYQHRPQIMKVYDIYNEIIAKLKLVGRVGTASNYQSSMNSLKAFSSKLSFRDISVEFLRDYETWLTSEGKSISTVGIYLRPLRAVINQSIEEGLISKDNYPFGKRRYQIPATRNIKKALTMEELSKIYYFPAIQNTWWEKAKDFFLFSYLANGINIKDIALLRYQNIDGEFIRFTRAKTRHTLRHASKQISVYISPEISQIIDRWKNKDTRVENFLFPILEPNLTADRERVLIQQFTKMVNKYINRIALEVGIQRHVTTYYARHSFATVLLRNGTGTELISESLGHSNIKTTTNYLDSFEDETKKELALALTKFI
ncbi:site-specific integrase [soil metagenome]